MSGLHYCLFCLFVVFFSNYTQFLLGVTQHCLLVGQLVPRAVKLVSKLFVLLHDTLQPHRRHLVLFPQCLQLLLLVLYDVAILVLFGLEKCIELRIVHEHLLFEFGVGYQNLLLEVRPLGHRVIYQFLHPVDLNEKFRLLNLIVGQVEVSFVQALLDA